MNKGFIQSFDGTKIYYEEHGSGLPLILCYGLVCTRSQWKYQVQYFKKKYRVILFDYRGHNLSSLPKKLDHLTIDACAKDLGAVMNHLNLSEAVLLGHSMGINVIFDFSKKHPEKVLRLIAICGTVENPFQTMFNTDLSLLGFEFLKSIYLKFPRHFSNLWKKSVVSPLSQLTTSLLGFNAKLTQQKDIKKYLNGVSQQPVETFFHLLQEMVYYKGLKSLHQIQTPTLIIGGERDLITPIQNQKKIHQKIKGSKFLMVPKGSHCAHMDMHDYVNHHIEHFLNEGP